MLKIGNLKIKSNLILAPMSGVSDLPFRLLNRQFGCELAFVEMLNVRSVSYKSRKTMQMLFENTSDRPLGIQLLGSEAKYILPALEVLKKYKFDILDFNAACPERKVIRRGEGASLLNAPDKLHGLLKLLVEHVSVPVTVKIRTGWDKRSVNARDVARYAEDAGIKALFIHGRTKEQGYSGSVDYEVIKKVKDALSIPVVASGDILSAPLARKMFNETGCDGILIARGSFGNPWIFKEIPAYLENDSLIKKPDRFELVEVMRRHLNSCIDFYDERTGIVIFRKFFAWYTRGLRKVRHLREKASYAKTKTEVYKLFDELQRK